MTDCELHARNLANYLKRWHRGAENAVSAADLVQLMGLTSDRELRDVVRAARHELQEPIAATFSGHYCYPVDAEDDALAHTIAQQLEMSRRYAENARALVVARNKVFSERLF